MTTAEKRIPKYIEISNSLRDLIVSGEVLPGEKLPTEKELAKRYGVSLMSVRGATRKLKDDGYISGIRGSGLYVSKPNHIHDCPKSCTTAFYTDLPNTYNHRYLPMLQSITKAAMRYGMRIEILHSPDRKQAFSRDKNFADLIKANQFGGLILFANAIITWDDYHFFDRSGIPFVINNMCRDIKGRGILSWNQGNWFDQIIECMVSRDYRKIAVLVGPMNAPEDFIIRSGQRMISAYKRMMKEVFIKINPNYLMEVDWTAESGYVAGKKLLSLSDPPEVISAADDLNALGVIKAALDMGLSVPENIKVWGRADFLNPSFLSSVSSELERRGHHLISSLIQVMEGDEPDQLPSHFKVIHRASASEDGKDDVIRHWIEEYFTQNPMNQKLIEKLEKKVQPVSLTSASED